MPNLLLPQQQRSSWEGDCFRTRGISYCNDQVAGNEPRGLKMARNAAAFNPGDCYWCDSTHILWSSLLRITSVNLLCNLTHWWYCAARSATTSFGTFACFASLKSFFSCFFFSVTLFCCLLCGLCLGLDSGGCEGVKSDRR